MPLSLLADTADCLEMSPRDIFRTAAFRNAVTTGVAADFEHDLEDWQSHQTLPTYVRTFCENELAGIFLR